MKIRKAISISFVVILLFVNMVTPVYAGGWGDLLKKKLDQPVIKEKYWTNDGKYVVEWSPITGASGYEFDNGTKTTDCSILLNVSDEQWNNGKFVYSFKIRSISEDTNYKPSKWTKISISEPTPNPQKLNPPTVSREYWDGDYYCIELEDGLRYEVKSSLDFELQENRIFIKPEENQKQNGELSGSISVRTIGNSRTTITSEWAEISCLAIYWGSDLAVNVFEGAFLSKTNLIDFLETNGYKPKEIYNREDGTTIVRCKIKDENYRGVEEFLSSAKKFVKTLSKEGGKKTVEFFVENGGEIIDYSIENSDGTLKDTIETGKEVSKVPAVITFALGGLPAAIDTIDDKNQYLNYVYKEGYEDFAPQYMTYEYVADKNPKPDEVFEDFIILDESTPDVKYLYDFSFNRCLMAKTDMMENGDYDKWLITFSPW